MSRNEGMKEIRRVSDTVTKKAVVGFALSRYAKPDKIRLNRTITLVAFP